MGIAGFTMLGGELWFPNDLGITSVSLWSIKQILVRWFLLPYELTWNPKAESISQKELPLQLVAFWVPCYNLQGSGSYGSFFLFKGNKADTRNQF